MTKTKSTKRALGMSAMALFLCFTMLLGTTFAWFTDSVTSANNVIKSGNLDVEMYWADGTKAVPADGSADWADASAGAIFDYANWEPGYAVVRHIKIANEGTLALKYKLAIVANGKVSDLADVIDVYYVDPAVQVADRAQLTDANKLGTLTEVLANLANTANGELLAGENDTITLALKMQETAGNEYQNKSIGTSFSVQLLATQLTYEKDSFDKEYDADIDPQATYVSTPEDFANAINNDDERIVLLNDIALNDPVTVDSPINLNLNGKTLTVNTLNVTAEATVNNGTLASSVNTNMVPPIIFAGGHVEMNDVKVDVNHYLNASANWSEAVGISVQNSTAVFNNCDININNQKNANWVFAYGIDLFNAEITINGGKITVVCVEGNVAPNRGPTNPIAVSSYGNCTATLKNVDVNATYYGSAVGGCLTINTTDRTVQPTAFANNNGGSYSLNFID